MPGIVYASAIVDANGNPVFGDFPVVTVDKSFTNDEILAAYTTPMVVVPASGAGLALVPLNMQTVVDASAAAYTTGAELMSLQAGGSAIATLADAMFTTQDVNLEFDGGLPGAGYTPVENADMVLTNTVADYTGGNSANGMRVIVQYIVVSTTVS